MKMRLAICVLFVVSSFSAKGFASERYFHAGAGATSAQQLPIYAAKDLGLYEKYGLDVDLLVVTGGSHLLQALIGGSINSASVSAMAPARAIASGANLAIVATFLNKNFYVFVTRKEIRTPLELRGKKIGVAGFGGANQFSVFAALKAWNLSADTVKLVATGNNMSRLAAMEAGGIDGTVIPYSSMDIATKRGMNILGKIPDIVKEFPDRTIVMERSFIAKRRATAKRFLQAVCEAIYRLEAEPDLREKAVATLMKQLRVNRQLAEEAYDTYHNVFSFPPRTGRRGLQDVLDIIQTETGRPKADYAASRFLDESILDELQQQGFFKKLQSENLKK